MHEFKYKNNELYCESVRVSQVATKVGTPFYLYSYATFLDHFHKLQNAFQSVKPIICFSVKSNSNLAVLKSLVKAGAGLDIVSGGELYRALKVGADPQKIVFAGVGKTEDEIEFAIKKKILFFNVESLPELEAIQRVAKRIKQKARVSLRVNPDVKANTHAHITTGTSQNKFGIDFSHALWIFKRAHLFTNVKLVGLHVHIGSQITEAKPFLMALHRVFSLIDNLNRHGADIRYLNMGGGLGVIYKDEKPQTAQQFAKQILPQLKKRSLQYVFEPGRFIAGNSGIFVTKVLYNKVAPAKHFVIVDGAMNDLLRPSLYDAYHGVLPVKKRSRKKIVADIVGPICESGDYFAKNRALQTMHEGELLAIMTAGAYGFTMSSNYNTRPRVAEVMVKGSQFEIIRKRESWDDCLRGERIPAFLK